VTGTATGLLREPDFRQLFLATTVSHIGSQVGRLALPLVAVLALHAGPAEVGVLSAANTVAFLLIGLPAGAWIDRMRRRSVMLVGDLGRVVLVASVPLAWWAGILTMPQLYAVALIGGAFTVFFDIAYQSYLPHVVGRDRLVDGNAKLSAVSETSRIVGPTLGGLLVQAVGAPVAIVADAASFLVSAFHVGRIRRREEPPERRPDARLGHEIREGVRFVLGNGLLRPIVITTGTSNFWYAVVSAMLVVLLADTLHLPAGTIGVYFSLAGLGGLTAAFVARPLAARLGQGPGMWQVLAVTGFAGLLVPLARPGVLLWTACLGSALYGFGAVFYNIVQVSFRQRLTPERLLGRMNATIRFLVWGPLPLGALAGGLIGQYVSVRTAVWVGSVGGALTFLPILFSPLRTMRHLPEPE